MNRSNRENVPGKGAMHQFVTPPVKRLAPRAEQIGFTSTKQDKLDAADPTLGHPVIFFCSVIVVNFPAFSEMYI